VLLAGLDHPAMISALMWGWGALDEDDEEASDMRFDGRLALEKKFNGRPVAPSLEAAVADGRRTFDHERQEYRIERTG
jgi:hypothetical protein